MVVSVLAVWAGLLVRTVPGLPMVGFQPHEVYMEAGPAPPLPPAAEVGSVVVKSLPSLGVAPHPNDPLGSWAEHEYVEHHRPRRRAPGPLRECLRKMVAVSLVRASPWCDPRHVAGPGDRLLVVQWPVPPRSTSTYYP